MKSLVGPFAQIVIDGTGPHLDRCFTYSIPAELKDEIRPGHYVKVPWGKRSSGGVVRSIQDQAPTDLDLEVVRDILELAHPQPVLGPVQWKLLDWLADFYFATPSAALRCLLPGPVLEGLRRGTKSRLKAQVQSKAENPRTFELSQDQQQVWDSLSPQLGQRGSFLLHGVTGSGKTEVYLRSTAKILEEEKTALVLVPEVSLTPQAQARYRERFGTEVSILHSGLTPAQRRQQWWRIKAGEAKVVVGTRSAIFAPLEKCGLIVIDEEHDTSYKQGSELRYHARQVAAWLSRELRCTVLLGSATPSLESYTLAQRGHYQLLELPRRISARSMPQVSIVEGWGIPHQVLKALKGRKERGEKSVVLLNRRGYSHYLQCQDCAWVPECPDCSISLTFHRRDNSLRCHYCGARQRAPERCADCGGNHLDFPGRGTERVENELAQRLPELRLARLDRDTVGGRAKVFEETFDAFEQGEYDCLLGTQMVSKGLDFPEVTLVVVLQADTGLHMPDFRAAERSFALLTQVAGRAGRGEKAGEVILVTRRPEQEIFQYVVEHRFTDFLERERRLRQDLLYPPYCRLLRILMTDTNEKRLETFAEDLGELLSRNLEHSPLVLNGPSPCPLEKLQTRYRWHLVLRAPTVQDLQVIVRKIPAHLKCGPTRLAFDPDPLDLM